MNLKRLKYKKMDSWIIDIVSYGMILLFSIICVVPFVYVITFSLTPYTEYLKNPIQFFPRFFNLSSYKQVLGYHLIASGYKNTVFIVLVSTPMSLALLTLTAYPLTKKVFLPRRFIMFLWMMTMFFSGGMIPNYYLMSTLKLTNTLWALILPGLAGAFNLILMRNFINEIPESLEEAAFIDGANEIVILFRVVLPLCLPALATLALFHAVGAWNSYFNAIIYVNKRALWPLQLVLREIIIEPNIKELNTDLYLEDQVNPFTLKMAAIIVATLPIMCVYPFLQKYFMKGLLLGSVKE
ncbi:MAG: carbohydrate ABC transporter permease [Christensenellales bacterium]|jgi:putative aldouronate transport system permease protein